MAKFDRMDLAVDDKKGNGTISEEDIALEMIEHDFVVKMPPKKEYKIHVLVKSVSRGEPRIVEDNEKCSSIGINKKQKKEKLWKI